MPPKAVAAVFVPEPTTVTLATFKSFTSVQLVPFQLSVAPVTGGLYPPNAKAAVCIPTPPREPLPVFKSLTSVQLDPFQLSVTA